MPVWGPEAPPYLIGVFHFGALVIQVVLPVTFFCRHHQKSWKRVPAGARAPPQIKLDP